MRNTGINRLAIVVPCYNEEEVIVDSVGQLLKVIEQLINNSKIANSSYILCVDDGSKDNTWKLIEQLHSENSMVKGLKLAGNVGHQNALTAGLLASSKCCDMTISIDADLQDDIAVMEEMVDKFLAGKDIVYGVRKDRSSDSFFKRVTAQGFYKLMHKMGVKTVYNHADFRLMSKRAVEQFGEYKETNLFLRGIVTTIGYDSDIVYYERKKRLAGESKYPLKKMIGLALDGITSFSVKPISIIIFLGSLIVFCSIVATVYALISYICGHVTAGWTSLILSIWFIGGVQLLSIGLIGQYIGKIYMEVKHRPRYNIEVNMLEKEL